jgi:hypothetical protein
MSDPSAAYLFIKIGLTALVLMIGMVVIDDETAGEMSIWGEGDGR